MAAIIMLFSFYCLYAIQDPDLKKLHSRINVKESAMNPESTFENLSIKAKALKFTEICTTELSRKPILTLCVIGASITRLIAVLFSTYLILWIETFPSVEGEEGKNIYFEIMVISVILSSFILPCVGAFLDSYPAIRVVPLAFLFRCFTTYCFYLLETPDTYLAYTVCVFMIVATILESNAIDSIFTKNLVKETRGLLCGLYMFVGNIGILLFSLTSGWMYDNIGPKSPFVFIGVLDFLFAIVSIFM